MKKLVFVAAVAALLVAPAALADKPAGKGEGSGKAAACKALRKATPDLFGKGKKYRNLGACVSAKTQESASASSSNAAKICKAERADASFAGSHGGKSFADFYGTNANRKNAFGKCVSRHSKQT